jgi:hypothetical protein
MKKMVFVFVFGVVFMLSGCQIETTTAIEMHEAALNQMDAYSIVVSQITGVDGEERTNQFYIHVDTVNQTSCYSLNDAVSVADNDMSCMYYVIEEDGMFYYDAGDKMVLNYDRRLDIAFYEELDITEYEKDGNLRTYTKDITYDQMSDEFLKAASLYGLDLGVDYTSIPATISGVYDESSDMFTEFTVDYIDALIAFSGEDSNFTSGRVTISFEEFDGVFDFSREVDRSVKDLFVDGNTEGNFTGYYHFVPGTQVSDSILDSFDVEVLKIKITESGNFKFMFETESTDFSVGYAIYNGDILVLSNILNHESENEVTFHLSAGEYFVVLTPGVNQLFPLEYSLSLSYTE